ncbi:uncharacterized protein METZ01_LOCUS319182, partial [marine metagenome]
MSKRNRKRKRIKNDSNTFFKEYNFELLVLGLFTLGFFLLWEKWNIKALVWGGITSTALFVITFLRNVSVRIGSLLSGVETSDLIGIILILIAVILVLNRARLRTIERHPNLVSCPKCDSGLRRVHRKTKHKIQSWFYL